MNLKNILIYIKEINMSRLKYKNISRLEHNMKRFFNWLWRTYYITEYEYYGLTYAEQEFFWKEYSLFE